MSDEMEHIIKSLNTMVSIRKAADKNDLLKKSPERQSRASEKFSKFCV